LRIGPMEQSTCRYTTTTSALLVRLFRPAVMFVVMHMYIQRHGRHCKQNVLTIG
jgi:hypothetical protein